MSDWFNKVVRIESIIKHPDADNLSIALTTAGDYPIVIRTEDYKVGDLAAYISIDSVLPDTEEFHSLTPVVRDVAGNILGRKYVVGSTPEHVRVVKARRLRKIYSQGLLWKIPETFVLDQDVTEHFGLTKVEEDEEDTCLSEKKKKYVQDEFNPEGWSAPFYDIEGVRKYSSAFDNQEVYVSEKCHGANGAFCHDGNNLWCKSRNHFKRGIISFTDAEGIVNNIESTDQWWFCARKLNLAEKLIKYPLHVFFGEVIGQVGGFSYDASKENPTVKFFDIWDVKNQCYLQYVDFKRICKELELPIVPELYVGIWNKDLIFKIAEGNTTLGKQNHVREGVVIKTTTGDRTCFKLVGEGYNLKK